MGLREALKALWRGPTQIERKSIMSKKSRRRDREPNEGVKTTTDVEDKKKERTNRGRGRGVTGV